MMTQIIDRRLNGKNKSAVNRQRFISRFKQQIKKAVADAISRRSITEIEKGEKVNIPAKDLTEPMFRYGQGGRRDIVHAGNQDFVTGDRIKRPLADGGNGQGTQASNSPGSGEDDFGFEISREEFLELFFEDLALPDLVKKQMTQLPVYTSVRAGFKRYGMPSSLNILRSMRNAYGRRIALANPHKKRLLEAEEVLDKLIKTAPGNQPEILSLQKEIELLKNKIAHVPFIDTIDLRFNNYAQRPKPTTQAVMFCLMDVSGSMDETRKELAKRFFILLYLFLTRTYKKIEVVFVRHHTIAKEVEEQEFFYSRETGGTVVSSALELMIDIIRNRYPTDIWNIYGAQASDGDNWNADSPHCSELLLHQILPYVQYYAYVEILPQAHQNLWESYSTIHQYCKNFAMKSIDSATDIYPVFRELFKRKTTV